MKIKLLLILLICFYGSYTVYSQPCGGVERWDVKVLADSEAHQVNFSAINTTVETLRSFKIKKKKKKDDSRQGIEFRTYRVRAFILFYRYEEDGDIHIVISDRPKSKKTMIVEVPGVHCKLVKKSGFAKKYEKVWETIRKNTVRRKKKDYFVTLRKYTITGIAFIDFNHSQTGRSANNLELHPVISIK